MKIIKPKIFNIISNIRDEFPEEVIFTIVNRVHRRNIDELKLPQERLNQKKQAYVTSGKSYIDTIKNTEFEVIFSMHSPLNYIEKNTIIKEIYDGKGNVLDLIPENGYGISLIEFEKEIPDTWTKLSYWGSKSNPDSNEFIYLTSKKTMQRILELWDKEEI